MKRIIPVGVLLGSASNACAAAGEGDGGSGLFVWGFLGFCALIVVVQAIPALLVMFGLAKGIAGHQPAVKKTTTATMGSE